MQTTTTTFTKNDIATKQWKIDNNHSGINFRVKHLGVAEIRGSFMDYKGSIKLTKNNFENCEINVVIQADSINTANSMRDNHLRTGDFLESALHPEITFRSAFFIKREFNKYLLTGELTIKSITKIVRLEAEYLGLMTDMWGNEVSIFKLKGSINRMDFDIKWHHILDNGIPVISQNIDLDMNIELMHDDES